MDWLYAIRARREGFLDAPTDDEVAAMRAHFAYLKDAADRGRVLLAGPATDGKFPGIVVFRAADEPEARAFMESDPSVIAGVMAAELHPFRVSLVGGPVARHEARDGGEPQSV
jgi:uncharacterized protein